MLALPQLGVDGPAQAVFSLARTIDPTWTDLWTIATVVSLGPNLLAFALGSVLMPPSADELAAAEECGLDVEAGARRLRRPASPGLLKARLGPLLGAQTATLLVDRAAREVDLEPAETSPEKLRRLEEQVQAALTSLLGPLLGPAVLDGVNVGATSQLAAQVRFLEERLHRAPTGALAQVEMVRRYLKGVLDDLPVGVCALGPDDDVVVWNRALEQLSGLFARDWVGHELDELPAPFGPALASWTRQSDPPGEEVLEIDDERRSLAVRVSTLAGGGKVVTLEDLTGRRRLEQQLVHEDRLRSLGQLTAAIGHEIGNPLTGILMLSRNLAAEKEPEDLPERLGLIVSESEKIESIVKSMTAFARAGSDHALAGERHRERPIVIQEVIEDALQLVRMGRKNKAIHWS
ncbi:MAG: histidine kinase dimerization/phospho-acceptor domain-containing protein, partial [Myxococcota bacterium]